MVKALSFKGDKKPSAKKRKRAAEEQDAVTQTAPADGADGETDDNQWVSADALTDISGPVLLVLPTSPPTSLSCDQLGKVFAQKIENLVEGLPDSAEPHDVRQVWIATRVVGSEGTFTLKGHHGRYLGCDQYGICSALREAISPEETLTLEALEGKQGVFAIKTNRMKYISVNDDKDTPEVRGDAEEVSESSGVRVRMQARFKPQHKVEKAEKVRAKISRKELEEEVGRRLEDDEVKRLKKARREGDYHEVMLDVKVKGKHDKFA
jgi:protein FRG1